MQDPSAFELALAEAALDAPSVVGIIVNFVCKKLLWGAWVSNHFYAIIKGPAKTGARSATSAKMGLHVKEASTVEDNTAVSGHCGCSDEAASSKTTEAAMTMQTLSTGQEHLPHPALRRQQQPGDILTTHSSSNGMSDDSGRYTGVERKWFSLDSRLKAPQRLGETPDLLAHLAQEVREHHGHVFVVCDAGR